MGRFYDEIPEFIIPWILEQQVFWVASAPLSPDGHVNISPKGLEGTFHVVDSHRVWYEDLSGSGVETIAHIRENGRITVLFNAFEGPPRIVRLFGQGTVYEYGTPEYEEVLPPLKRKPGSRSVIVIDVHKVGTSCGYAVPFYEFKTHRTKLLDFFGRKEAHDIEAEAEEKNSSSAIRTKDGLRSYWVDRNSKSIDGLPGVLSAYAATMRFVKSTTVFKTDDTSIKQSVGVIDGLLDAKILVGFSIGVLASVAVARLV